MPHQCAQLSIASAWGVVGVMGFLFNGVRRVVPVALQPFADGMSTGAWITYVLAGVFFAYAEGYKGFQLRFSPLVVRRALLLGGDNEPPRAHQVLAPAYAMAFFHAKPRRKAMSYGLIVGIFAVVSLVKKLPYPYRSILDAGVCVGLSWGLASIGIVFLNALRTGRAP